MINPEFPYKNNQIILSSDRVILHAKSEAVLVFGKQMVGLASNGTVNIDAKEKILLDSDKIELGNNAEIKGEPVVLGVKLVNLLMDLITSLQFVGDQMSTVSKTGDAASWSILQECGIDIKTVSSKLLDKLLDVNGPNTILSKNTYTR